MGQAESNPIRNMDKRTARREYRDDFTTAIQSYRNRIHSIENNTQIHENDHELWNERTIRVCVRRRPIFHTEISNHEFDVVTCIGNNHIVIHDARMHTDMRRRFINHHQFNFDRVFNESCNNDEVYADTAAPLVDIAIEGGYATCLMYGQTGSGKTYTMSSIYERAARDLYSRLSGEYSVSLSFCELAGDQCFDLLNAFQPVQLLTGQDGSVHAFPIVEPEVSSAEELLAMIQYGCSVRTTAATGVHDTSSRSHAILRIYVQSVSNPGNEGVLTLVDLAGSEHRIDSMYHGAERRKEGAAINSSLMALKECIRAKAAGRDLNHYYRKSKLTMALKWSFADSNSRTVVIVTVSPASKDTEHSLNSLRHACIMDGQDTEANGETRFVTGGKTTVEQIGEVNVSAISKKAIATKKAGGHVDGPKTSNGNTFGSNLSVEEDKALTEKERLRVRRASVKRANAALAPAYRGLLKQARTQLGINTRQQQRLNRRRQALAPPPQVQKPLPPPPEPSPPAVPQQRGREFTWELVEKPTRPVQHSPTRESDTTNRSPNSHSTKAISEPTPVKMCTPSSLSTPSSDGAGKTLEGEKGRRAVHKLRASIYTSAEDMVPSEIKRRQFGALLRQNGYSRAEVDDILAREEERERAEQTSRENEQRHDQSPRVTSVLRSQSQSAGSKRGGTESSLAHASPPDPPQLSRHEAAKLRRQQKEAEALNKRRSILQKKEAQSASASAATQRRDEKDHEAAIASLEAELLDPGLTSAARHGIMKRIATHRSVLVREARWKEQEKREAERRAAEVKKLAVKEEAARRLALMAPEGDKLVEEQQIAAFGPGAATDRHPPMRNTSLIESHLSPRERHAVHPPRPNVQERGNSSSQWSPVRGRSSGYSDCGTVGGTRKGAPGVQRSDSLDRHIQESANDGRASPVHYSNPSTESYSYQRRQNPGAASAPFANDMNWDK